MNDSDYNILDVWLSGEGTVRATNAISNPDKHRDEDSRRLSINISGSINTNSHPWAKTFKKIDVTLYFSDENPVDNGCACLSASEICLEGDVVYRDSLDIEAYLPTASFTTVSQILTSIRNGRPMLYLLADDDIATWAKQDEPELLKAQECAFDYDTQTPAAIEEQVPEAVTEQPGVDTARRRRRWRRQQNVEARSTTGAVRFGIVLFVLFIVLIFAAILISVFEWIFWRRS